MSSTDLPGRHCRPDSLARTWGFWLLLVLLTLFTWLLGEGRGGLALASLLLALAAAKVAVVAAEFMSLRRAPLLWPVLVGGWLCLVVTLIGLAYWKGISS